MTEIEASTTPDVNRWVPATLLARRPQNRHAMSLALEAPGLASIAAGQHVDIRLTAEDGYTAQRSYSVASAAGVTPIEVMVDRLPDGEVSPYLVEDLQVGEQVEMLGPIGRWFVWPADASAAGEATGTTAPVQLIAGGSGIVPLVSMLRTRTKSGATAPFRLSAWTRSPDDEVFADLLVAPEPDVTIHRHFTRSGPAGWTDRVGRPRPADLAAEVFPPAAGATSYICGPAGFVEFAANALIDAGHDARRIRTERFGPTT